MSGPAFFLSVSSIFYENEWEEKDVNRFDARRSGCNWAEIDACGNKSCGFDPDLAFAFFMSRKTSYPDTLPEQAPCRRERKT
jgi:hypothetical protein